MTDENNNHFASKHDLKKIDTALSEQIKENASDHRITCHVAHEISNATDVSPAKIGEQIDLLEYRLTKCQLGLFGYRDKKKFTSDIDITPELGQRIDDNANGKKISCIDCWKIAGDLNINRLIIGSACEKKGIKIKPCQLGAF